MVLKTMLGSLFYHDAYYRAVKWNEEGHIVEKIERKTGIEA